MFNGLVSEWLQNAEHQAEDFWNQADALPAQLPVHDLGISPVIKRNLDYKFKISEYHITLEDNAKPILHSVRMIALLKEAN